MYVSVSFGCNKNTPRARVMHIGVIQAEVYQKIFGKYTKNSNILEGADEFIITEEDDEYIDYFELGESVSYFRVPDSKCKVCCEYIAIIFCSYLNIEELFSKLEAFP